MTTRVLKMKMPAVDTEMAASDWKTIYRVGALAALLVVLAGLLDIAMIFLPGTAISPGDRTVIDWFSLYQSRTFLAMRDMGMLNMVTVSCSVVAFFALLGVHRQTGSPLAPLALVLVAIGAAIYIANNISLPFLSISSQYAAATGESQKGLLAAAGQALLAREDLTAGAFPGFFFGEIAGALMAVAALRGGIFRRWEAWVGIVAIGCLFFFNLCAAFIPALYDSVMPIFGAGGGLLSMVWYALIARRLLQAR